MRRNKSAATTGTANEPTPQQLSLAHRREAAHTATSSDLFDSDLDGVAVNLDAWIADSVQNVSKAPADRRRKRTKTAV